MLSLIPALSKCSHHQGTIQSDDRSHSSWFKFVPGDTLVAFVQQNGDIVRGHNFVWRQQIVATGLGIYTHGISVTRYRHLKTMFGHLTCILCRE
jgi:GH35 family endo-1,4-beta-xylanase